jgi:hypothetical protein
MKNRPSILTTVAAAALLIASAAPGFAQGNSNRGKSAAHVNTQGSINSNGRGSVDRDFGHARAAERMSDQGLAHNRAGIRAETNATAELNRDATRMARLRADERARLGIDRDDRVNNHGANKPGFCPPGQAKKAGKGSSFNC